MNAPQPLTFAALDGLAFAAERSRLDPTTLSAGALGPLLEWSGLGGRTDTLMLEGMESFVVRGGLIAAQTLNYTGAYVTAA